ncbi:peptidylprolyl isomerase [Sediminibacter sp. Hel_I_10]|uniref:peptidylprolyl isomerase n=1 Tax=Sediminibacter sp. Hel_I_10 TaxID=1392490 RepID=UPI00047E09B3|nr:peptidylprolyl isomerase [Sediminibacter sp. Hel_I_10]
MKLISKYLQLSAIALLFAFTSCNEEYPDLEDGLYAEFVTTKDTMVAKLFFEKTPVTVANFVALAEGNHPMVSEQYKGKRFYDSLTFHRVMDQFMIQGGDPTATGSGNPGYKFTSEFDPELKHNKPGILSMANSGGLSTNGSQFFITEVPYPSLDAYDADGNLKPCDQPRVSCHSVFGELVKGLDVQDSISNVKVGPGNKPVEDVVILKVNIIRKGSAAKSFNAPKVFEEQMPKLEEKIQGQLELGKLKAEEERQEREDKMTAAAEENKPMIDDFNSKSKTLASGLKVYMIEEGNGPKPKEGDAVMVLYEGYFTDGKLFDSNDPEVAKKNGAFNQQRMDAGAYGPVQMTIAPNAQMIQGFKEALAYLKVGDRAFFYLPSHLAYGERGNRGIAPDTDLTFIVEIKEIVE